MKKLLFLSRWYPYPFDNGSKIRIYNLLKELSNYFTVDLASLSHTPVEGDRKQEIQKICRKVWVEPFKAYQPSGVKAVLGFVNRVPRYYVDTFNDQLMAHIRSAQEQEAYDVVIGSQIDMATYLKEIDAKCKILEELELTNPYETYKRQSKMLRRLRIGLSWWKTANFVSHLFDHIDGVTVVSEKERQLIRKIKPDFEHIAVVPNGVEMGFYDGYFGDPEPGTLVYSGSLTYPPNFDAVAYFVSEIFPIILEKKPDATLYVTGKLDDVPIEKLPETRNVIFTGYLEDIRPRLAKSWVNIVPLRYGGGTRLKVLESLAIGTPVVSTKKGAEGLELNSGEHLLVAKSPDTFAANVLDVLNNADLRQRLSEQGRKAVAEKYNWGQIGEKLYRFIEKKLSTD